MTEQEKMKKGYLWGDDEENMALQARAKSLVNQFNSLPPEAMDERAELLKKIFGNVGENVWIVPPLTAAVGKYVSIGEGTYANMNLTLIDDWKITIGKNVLIGPNVTLCTTGHPIHPKHRAGGSHNRGKFCDRGRFSCDKGYTGQCRCLRKSMQSVQGNQ